MNRRNPVNYLITTDTQLAHTLRERRKSSGESQAAASRRCGLLTKTISLLENHPEKCSVDSLVKYLSYLNLELVLSDKPVDMSRDGSGEW